MTARPIEFVAPAWPAPSSIRAISTTRTGGESSLPYDSLNLGMGTGDAPLVVARNRARVRTSLGLDHDPCWLNQVHGARVVRAQRYDCTPQADASVGTAGSPACVVLTADCLPVVLCDTSGTRIGIAHAGWRGLASGVIPRCIEFMDRPGHELLAWLGPAIGPASYEVGPEVRDACLAAAPGAEHAFVPSRARAGHWLASLYAIAARQLALLGVRRTYGGGFCTYDDKRRFYSHRRDGVTGRFATLAWVRDSGPEPQAARERFDAISPG